MHVANAAFPVTELTGTTYLFVIPVPGFFNSHIFLILIESTVPNLPTMLSNGVNLNFKLEDFLVTNISYIFFGINIGMLETFLLHPTDA